MMRQYRYLTWIAVAGLLAAGCGSGSQAVKRVRGKVQLDGHPIGGALVHFLPPDKSDPEATSFVAKTGNGADFHAKTGKQRAA